MRHEIAKTILFLLLITASFFTFADDLGSTDITANRVGFISAQITLIKIVIFLIGLIVLISSIVKMKYVNDANQKSPFAAVVMGIFAATLMMNINASLSVFTKTFFDVDAVCMQIAEKKIDDNCFKDEMSGLTGDIKSRVQKLSNDQTASTFMTTFQLVIGIFQVIGLIYFAVGAYGLKEVANGSSKDGGYGKPIITMIAAALIVDIPHTAQMAIDTLHSVGLNF